MMPFTANQTADSKKVVKSAGKKINSSAEWYVVMGFFQGLNGNIPSNLGLHMITTTAR